MRILGHIIAIAGGCVVAAGCGEEVDGDEGKGFPDLESGNLSAEAWDWGVEGMSCDGEAVTRFVGLVDVDTDDGEKRKAHYFRGDDCVDAGDPFWQEIPGEDGDMVDVLVDSDSDEIREYELRQDEKHTFELLGDEEIRMRQVARELSPTPIPDLEDLELTGEWWMEGYPCGEELVPQLVRVLHSPGTIDMSKVVGDECMGDGTTFIEGASINGTSLEGTAWLVEPPEIPDSDAEGEVDMSGTVRTETFIGLDVAGQAVSLRRVKGE